MPTEIPVTFVTAFVNEDKAPVPANCIHKPVPTAGVLALSVALLTQIVCEAPAFEIVGGTSRTIVTVDDDGGHVPLVMVH